MLFWPLRRQTSSRSKKKAFKLILIGFLLLVIYVGYERQMKNKTSSVRQSDGKILMNIITNDIALQTVFTASMNTWIPLLPYDILYFKGKSSGELSLPNISNIITLPCDDHQYPSQEKTFHVWKYLYSTHLRDYDYFVVVDSYTYVNVHNLISSIKNSQCEDCYIDQTKIGASDERDKLGIQPSYCIAPGYLISHKTLSKFGSHVEKYQSRGSSHLPDAQLDRYIYKYLSALGCTNATMLLKPMLRIIDKNGVMREFKSIHQEEIDTAFPSSPPTAAFDAIFVHPLKKAEYFYQFHKQVTLKLRPILHPFYLNESCVANPVIQNEIYPTKGLTAECQSSVTNIFIDVNNPKKFHAFVITVENAGERAQKVIQSFRKQKINVEVFRGISKIKPPPSLNLTDGEWNLRLTMKRLLNHIVHNNFEYVLILEDDAIPHRSFASLFQRLLKDHRCSETALRGALLLGTTTWKSGWNIIDQYRYIEQGFCRNICTKTFGSFAVLLHLSAINEVLSWLNNGNQNEPYDFVFRHLSRLGYPVRFAKPNLVISDVRHISLIRPRADDSWVYNLSRRANVHRWKLKYYDF